MSDSIIMETFNDALTLIVGCPALCFSLFDGVKYISLFIPHNFNASVVRQFHWTNFSLGKIVRSINAFDLSAQLLMSSAHVLRGSLLPTAPNCISTKVFSVF